MTNILLAIIAIAEIVRLVLTHQKLDKKTHFSNKLRGTKQMVWDLEFKAFKTKEIREEIRQELDFMKSRVDVFTKQLDQMTKKDEGFGEVSDNLERAKKDVERLEGQIAGIDLELNGSKPTNQYPDGVTGVYHQIDSLRELVGMLQSYIKKL